MICFNLPFAKAQVAINNTNSTADNSAILDVQSNTKGMLAPRMTTAQRIAIVNPANGLIVYDTDRKALTTYNSGSGWAVLETIPSGKIFISDAYPDTLYPASDYDYMGTLLEPFNYQKNFGSLPGQWINKVPAASQSLNLSTYRKLIYTGSASNKVLSISQQTGYGCDSCIMMYNLNNDSVYRETIGYISRYSNFTATPDTTNARIFIWGGNGWAGTPPPYSPFMNKGFIYYYNTGVKVPMDSVTAPQSMQRGGHSAVWASSVNKLLVWGGFTNEAQGSGLAPNTLHAYDPGTNTWSVLATAPIAARSQHLAVYDGGDHMIIWGGDFPTTMLDGAVYTISTNTWTMMSATNAPTQKMYKASWTGSEVIFSNQNTSGNINTYSYLAYRYNPSTNTWTKIPDIPTLDGYYSRMDAEHIWTGTNLLQPASLIGVNNRMVLWSYSPVSNTWTPLAGLGMASATKGIQAGNTTVLSFPNNAQFQRYASGGVSPSYASVSMNWYYYKKK